jgi:hypothetical protein
MAQIAFERILEQFVTSRLDIDLVEVDLSAEKRLSSNGQVVLEAIDALKEHGVGVKNAGMTVNRSQLDEMLARLPNIREAELDKLATKSPNGAIRKGIHGNITREDIEFRNLTSVRPGLGRSRYRSRHHGQRRAGLQLQRAVQRHRRCQGDVCRQQRRSGGTASAHPEKGRSLDAGHQLPGGGSGLGAPVLSSARWMRSVISTWA